MTAQPLQTLRTDLIGGITTFLTMSYIVLINPKILSTPGTGLDFDGVLTATVLLCFSMTLFMGLYAKLPFAVAPGMGINAFFTFTVILTHQVPWQTALGMVFWSGVLFVLASLTPLRVAIANAIPKNLRSSVAVGIGIFLTFIGLKNAGLVTAHPATLVALGPITKSTALVLVSLFITAYLIRRKNPLAFLVGIFFASAGAWLLGLQTMPDTIFSTPNFKSAFFQMDLWGALQLSLLPTIIAFFFTDLFDSISTFIGVSQACDLKDEQGEPKNMKQGLIVDAFATLFAGPLGTSSGTAYIESAAGIEAGGRTGRASVVTALCFLPCLFIAPLAATVPEFATAPVLILVGSLMFRTVKEISLKNLEDAVPAFLTIVLIPLTFSITQGILWGFISHVVLYSLAGRRKEISPMLWAIGVLSVILLTLEQWR